MSGDPVRIRRAARDPWLERAQQLAEKSMLLANESIGETLQGSKAQALAARCRQPPSGFEEGANVRVRIEEVSIAQRTVFAAFVPDDDR